MNQPPIEEQIGAPGGHPDGPADAAERLVALEAELAMAKEQHARAVADYQNLRRRSEEGRQELARQTLSSLIQEFLPLLDDLGRAIDSVHDEIRDHPWVAGIEMVRRKFVAALEGYGVREIPADGQPFDPAVHEAIGYGPGQRDRVMLVAQAGYVLGDTLVRPARVIVGDGSVHPSESPTSRQDTAPHAAPVEGQHDTP